MIPQASSERVLRALSARPAARAPLEFCGWRCERLIGEGNLTRVFAAVAPESVSDQPAPYALKTLRESWRSDARAIAMLRRDGWIGEHVSHPHLAPTLASQLIEPPYFLVNPLLEGRSLAALLAAGQAPPLPLALWIARQVAEALDALNEAGWLHGDLKLSSVLVSPEFHVTLLDFGAAQPIGEPARLGERPLLSATRYLAPEMFSATIRVDGRSDIYSLGVLLLEMLVGAAWPEDRTRENVSPRVRDLTPGSVRRFVPAAPSRLAQLLHRMLAGDPLRRPRNPRELIDRLASLEIETFAEHLGEERVGAERRVEETNRSAGLPLPKGPPRPPAPSRGAGPTRSVPPVR